MRSILKAAFTIFSTLAIANVMAQCGQRGNGFQGGNASGYNYPASYSGSYSAGSTHSGYYDQYGQPYHGYQGQDWNHDQHNQSWDQDQYNQDWGQDQYNQGRGRRQMNQGGGQRQMNQGWDKDQYSQDWDHDGQYGYDQPRADHPVTDDKGQHIRYYGKPGPDYNQGMQQQRNQQAVPQNGQPSMQTANYNSYSQQNDWNNLANADHMSGDMHNDGMQRETVTKEETTMRNGGGSTKTTSKSTAVETNSNDPSTYSKW